MAVLEMFSPGTLGVGGTGFKSGTQSVSNPFGSGTPVWIQCTTCYVAGSGQSEFGISQISQLDASGQFEVVNFGDDHFGSFFSRKFVPRFLGLVATARTFEASIKGTLTLFSFG